MRARRRLQHQHLGRAAAVHPFRRLQRAQGHPQWGGVERRPPRLSQQRTSRSLLALNPPLNLFFLGLHPLPTHFRLCESPRQQSQPPRRVLEQQGRNLVRPQDQRQQRHSQGGCWYNKVVYHAEKMSGAQGHSCRKTSTTQPPDQFHLASSLMHQFTLPSHDDRSESEVFIGLANNYVMHGRSLSEMCEHNWAVAKQYGKEQVAVVWRIIKTMYGEEYVQNSVPNNREDVISHNNLPMNNMLGLEHENDQRSRGGDTPAAQFSDDTENEDQVDHMTIYNNGFPMYLNVRTGLPKGDFSFGENELDMELDGIITDFQSGYRNYIPQQDFVLPNEAFHIRHEIRNRSPPPDKFPNSNYEVLNDDSHGVPIEEQPTALLTVSNLPKMSLWDPSSIVLDALKHHAMLGDVQTAACVLIVLGDQRKCLTDLDESTQEHWLLGYIDLLSRFQLWNIATQIIKLSWIPAVEQMNQQSTRFNTNCSNCSKALQRIGWLCDRCHSSQYALCSVCHQVVKGLYAWCQGCSHGGHLLHMRQWFAVNKTCPAGCRHLCEYK
jgi:hypothetical protein